MNDNAKSVQGVGEGADDDVESVQGVGGGADDDAESVHEIIEGAEAGSNDVQARRRRIRSSMEQTVLKFLSN